MAPKSRLLTHLPLLLLLLPPLVLASQPVIVPFNVPNDLFAGSKVKLMCSVSKGSHPLQFRWLLNHNRVGDEPDLFLQQLDDANILNIRQLNPDKHNGNYTCTVTNQYGSASHTASLFVNSPPQWIQRPEPSGEFRQGSMVKVLCSASGHPKPKIRWQKVSRTGERVDWPSADTSETTLTFVSVKREHEGDYVCTASNSLKELVAKFTLLVKVPPTVEAVDDRGNALSPLSGPLVRRGRRGETLSIRCRAFGDSPLQITWTHQRSQLRPGVDGIDILSTGTDDGSLSELHFRSLDRKSAGDYRCEATNSLGSAQIVQQILVWQQPDPPSDVRVAEVDATGVKLEWKLPYDGNSPISALFVYYWQNNANQMYGNHRLHRIQPSSPASVSHVLTSLAPGVSYSAAVSALNELGESPLSVAVRFQTKTRSPSAAPIDLSIGNRLHNSITLNWKYPVQERLNGNPDFQIYYRPLGDSNFFIERLLQMPAEHLFSIRLSNLRPATEYEIKVRAFNRDGYGPDSEMLRCRTLSGPLPPSPKISYHQVVSRAYLVLKWEYSADKTVESVDELRYFIVYVERADTHMYSQQIPTSPSQRQITITNLEKDVPYHVYVAAANSNGESALSEPLIIKMRPSPIEMSLFMAEKNILAATAIVIGLFAILVAILASLFYMRHFQAVHRKKMQHLSGTTKSTATYATGYSSVGPAHHLPPPHPSSSNVIPVMVGYAHHQTASQGAFYGGGSSSGSTDYDKPTVMMAASSSKSVHHSPQLSQSFGHVSIRSTETAPITIDFEQQLKIKEKLCQSSRSLNTRNYDECIYDDASEI